MVTKSKSKKTTGRKAGSLSQPHTEKKRPVAVGDDGIYIYGIEYGIDDKVVWGWWNETRTNRSMIRYNTNGDPYFMAGGRRRYIDNYIRTNYGRM